MLYTQSNVHNDQVAETQPKINRQIIKRNQTKDRRINKQKRFIPATE